MAEETERERATAQGAGGMGPAHGQAPPEAAQHAVKEKKREMKSIEHAAFRALEDHVQNQASNCTGKKKRKKSGFRSLPRLATRRSRRWSQICEEEKRLHAAVRVLRDQIRDQAVKEEQREMKSNAHAAQNSQVLSLTHTSADLLGSMADETEKELATAQGAGGMGPAHGQAPPEAAQGVQRTQNSQVVSLTHTSADLVGSMADETEREHSTAQGARGMGPAHGRAPPEASQGVQTTQNSQGAGGMGPAHGQAPPKAAQGVQRTQKSQVLPLTHTSADLFGRMAERERSTAQGAGGMGPAHGQAPPEAAQKRDMKSIDHAAVRARRDHS
jgi:hypothetical protein